VAGPREELLAFPYVMPVPGARDRLRAAGDDQVFYFKLYEPQRGWPWKCESYGNGCGYTVRPFPAQLWWHWWTHHRDRSRLKRAST
jgi:hypothetical protein